MKVNSLVTNPTSFEPDDKGREPKVDIEERQEAILKRAGESIQVPSFGTPDWNHIAPKISSGEPLVFTFEKPERAKLSIRTADEITPVKPSEIDREKASHILENFHRRDVSYQISVCNEVLEIYERAGPDGLDTEEIINVKEIAGRMRALGEEEIAENAKQLIHEYFEDVENHPLVSKRSSSTLEDPVTFHKARQLLSDKEQHLRETSLEVFGEIDEKSIEDMKMAYLALIWDDIQEF